MFGDSITDMGRNYDTANAAPVWHYGSGYPFVVTSRLSYESPKKHEIINRGIGGNRVVDLYQRIKVDVWNHKPDLLSILIGVNDVWHEIVRQNGVEIDRFEKVYRMLIDDTLKVLPNLKIMLVEPYVLKGSATEENIEKFKYVFEYAKVVKKIAKDYGFPFVPLQAKFDEMSQKYGVEYYLYDGVHPDVPGATLIAEEWLKVFKENFDK